MNIYLKSILSYITGALVFAALLFVPAGTLDYWQAWLYFGVLMVLMFFSMLYFLATDLEFVERRFKTREKEKEQQLFLKLAPLLVLLGLVLPGFGVRSGWELAAPEVSIAADVVVLIGYGVVFWVYRENRWAGKTIRVEKGQKVVSTGPYARVRHPMYAGMLIWYFATPLALGLYVAIVPYLLFLPVLYIRIKNEEEVLSRELKGYKEYCRKVKWRLVPGVW